MKYVRRIQRGIHPKLSNREEKNATIGLFYSFITIFFYLRESVHFHKISHFQLLNDTQKKKKRLEIMPFG